MSTYNKSISKSELALNILQTYQILETELRTFLKPYGITLQQYNVLKILRGAKKPLSTSVIRERMLEPMADTSRLVDRLRGKGLVERCTSCGDRRLVDVTISKKGNSFLEKMTGIDQVLHSVFGKLDYSDAERLNSLLDKLRG